MRLDDYQRWLDSQFFDDEEKVSAAPPEPPVLVEEVVSKDSTLPTDSPPEPQSSVANLEPAKSAPTLETTASTAQSPAPRPEVAATTRFMRSESDDEDLEVPSLDNYLPMFRSRETPVESPDNQDSAIPESSAPTVESHVTQDDSAATDAIGMTVDSEAAPESPVAEPASPSIPEQPESASDEMAAEQPVEQPEPEIQVLERAAGAPVITPARKIATTGGRARQVRVSKRSGAHEDMNPEELWNLVPRHLKSLLAVETEGVARNSYTREFKESRVELIQRLLDPTLSLEETARLLNVCPTTVRRYTNRGLLTHHRTTGDQRRFKLSDVLVFLDSQSDEGASESQAGSA